MRNPEAKPKPTVRDQRVRVLFSTHIQTDVSHAESIFDVIQRPIKLPECRDRAEPQPVTTPQRRIALTLMRAFEMEGFSRTLSKDPNPEANYRQNLGVHTFCHATYPHPGNWRRGEVFKQAYAFNSLLRVVQCVRGEGESAKSLSFMQLQPSELVVSAIGQAEGRDNLMVRFSNSTNEKIMGTVRFFKALKRARLLNFLEQFQEDLKLENRHSVRLEVFPRKIVTIELAIRFRKRNNPRRF